VVHVPFLNRAFDTTPLSAANWALCTAMASSVLWLDEMKKLLVRRSVNTHYGARGTRRTLVRSDKARGDRR
jgi:Ca2+-transporting ATPase